MTKVKTVSVTYDRKINLGDFNSASVGITIWADVEEGDDLDAAMSALWAMATANVKAKAGEFYPQMKVQTGKTFLGLPVANDEQGEACNAD